MPPTTKGPGETGSEDTIDWETARRFVRDVVARALRGRAPDEIEDVTQQALIGVYRAVQRSRIQNLEAFMVTVANRQSLSFLRRMKVVSKHTDAVAAEVAGVGAPTSRNDVDLIAWIRFLVAEALGRGSECHELALAHFAGRSWKELAAERGTGHAALRKRWSRCVQTLKERIADDDRLTLLSHLLREAT